MATQITPALPLLPPNTIDVACYSRRRLAEDHQTIVQSLFQVEAKVHPLPAMFERPYALVVPATCDVAAIRRAIFARGEVR